jgi:ribonuclease P protein component
MRLPRKHSMTHRDEFTRVRTTGQAKAGRFVVLSTLADPSLDGIRTGFITTKKSGKAHDRVRLRRIFRSMIRDHAADFGDLRRYLVTIARHGASTATFAELEADWLKQARRLGLFTPAPSPADG